MTTKHRAAVQLGRMGGKARAARMSKAELSEAGRKAASAPRGRCDNCGHLESGHVGTGGCCLVMTKRPFGFRGETRCACAKFTPRPSRRKVKDAT